MEGNDFERSRSTNPVVFYLVTKALPFAVDLILSFSKFDSFTSIVLSICLNIVEMWLVKNIYGVNLIGLRWWIDREGLKYYLKPDPFVPIVYQSNVFWIGLFISVILYFIFSICFLNSMYLLIFLIADVFQIYNLVMFIYSYKKAKKSSDANLLTVLQDEDINFELVKDDDEKEENKSD